MKRHADELTVDHLIELRKLLAEAERQRDNVMDALMQLKMENYLLKEKLEELKNEKARAL